jgi:hypothetical protein
MASFSVTFREFMSTQPMPVPQMGVPAQGRQFMQGDNMDEEKRDIEKTLGKLPPSHAGLVRGYRWKFHAGNTLNGDDEHVGYVDDNTKEIAVAGPWNYGREFTILHEVAHKVWEQYVSQPMKKQWHQIVAATKHKQDQEPEELFCMAYANHYAKNKIVIHSHKEWDDFIKGIPQ